MLNHHHWSGPRAQCYNLDNLAVDQGYQSGQVGRRLVQNGLEEAARLNVSAAVVSAEGKDTFYMSCGFSAKVGSVTEGEGNPLAGVVRSGSILFWDPPSVEY
jgi:predicted N-acetyltransferase YhbS